MNKKLFVGILIGLSFMLCAAHIGGGGTYQGVINDDGSVLAVIDTRTGGYKVRRIRAGDNVEELFNAKERHIQNYAWDKQESD